jgi:hypothetical protein
MTALIFALAVATAGQECRCPCNPGAATAATTAVADRDVIRELEPVPTARPGPPPDANWMPDLAPGEYLVPGSVRDVPVRLLRYQAPPVKSAPAPMAPVPAPQVVPAPQAYAAPYQGWSGGVTSYAAPMPFAGSSCYASSYSGGSSYGYGGTQAYSVPAPVYSAPAPIYSMPAPIYSTPAPMYAAPAPVPARRRPGFRYALQQRSRLRIAASAELDNGLNLGMGLGGGAACGPWGCR